MLGMFSVMRNCRLELTGCACLFKCVSLSGGSPCLTAPRTTRSFEEAVGRLPRKEIRPLGPRPWAEKQLTWGTGRHGGQQTPAMSCDRLMTVM